jgi:flagellar assembly protein FliH
MEQHISKVVKKCIKLDEPFPLNNRSEKYDSIKGNKYCKDGVNPIAFSAHIDEEIDNVAKQVTQQLNSQSLGYKKEIETSFRNGYEKGFADGMIKERTEQMKVIDTLFKEAKHRCDNSLRCVEVKVIDLAIEIAEKIIQKSIATSPELVVDMFHDIISLISENERIVLKVSPEDFEILQSCSPQYFTDNHNEVTIEVDRHLNIGDCRIEAEGGTIDGVVKSRLDILVDELLCVTGVKYGEIISRE